MLRPFSWSLRWGLTSHAGSPSGCPSGSPSGITETLYTDSVFVFVLELQTLVFTLSQHRLHPLSCFPFTIFNETFKHRVMKLSEPQTHYNRKGEH